MSVSNDVEFIAIPAGEDLSSRQYHIVNYAGTLAANGADAVGSLYNKPKTGEPCMVAQEGKRTKMIAGAAIAKGKLLTVTNSGFVIGASSGDHVYVIGKNIDAAVNSGDVFAGVADFSAPGMI